MSVTHTLPAGTTEAQVDELTGATSSGSCPARIDVLALVLSGKSPRWTIEARPPQPQSGLDRKWLHSQSLLYNIGVFCLTYISSWELHTWRSKLWL